MDDRITAMVAAGTLLSALLTGRTSADSAQDYWPAWRGPLASGVSPRGRPPLTWSETQNVKGKVPVPGPAADPNAPPPFHGGKKCLYGISPG